MSTKTTMHLFGTEIHLSLCKPCHLHDNSCTGNMETSYLCTATSSNWIRLHLCTLWIGIIDWKQLLPWDCWWWNMSMSLILSCFVQQENVFFSPNVIQPCCGSENFDRIVGYLVIVLIIWWRNLLFWGLI